MKTMLIGGSGFIGSSFLNLYDFDSIVIDKVSYQNKTVGVDITSDKLEDYFTRDIDVIIHLADSNLYDKNLGMFDYYNNVIGTLNIVKCMKKYKIKHIIYLSTSHVYGEGSGFDESSSLSPYNTYLNTKIACENIIKDYCVENSSIYQILRVSSVSGCINNNYITKSISYQQGHLISTLIDNYFKQNRTTIANPRIVRDYIHIKDLCECIHKCIESKISGIFNVGTGISTDVTALVEKIRKQTGEISVIYNNKDIPAITNTVNNSLFCREFDMDFKYNLDSIIADCLTYGRRSQQ